MDRFARRPAASCRYVRSGWPPARRKIAVCPDQSREFLQGLVIGKFAFPYLDGPPPEFAKLLQVPQIPLPVSVQLGLPERAVRLRHVGEPAVFVPVPETTPDFHDGPISRENDVRSPGQVLAVELEAEAGTMEEAADEHFGLRILPSDARHHRTAGRGVYDVRHVKRFAVWTRVELIGVAGQRHDVRHHRSGGGGDHGDGHCIAKLLVRLRTRANPQERIGRDPAFP